MTSKNETRPMAGTMGGLVGTSELSCCILTPKTSQRQAPLGAAAEKEAAQRASRSPPFFGSDANATRRAAQ